MNPIIQNPTNPDAIQAGCLAQRCYELSRAWLAPILPNPEVEDALRTTQTRIEEHQARTGWVADHDGETTFYHYTGPDTGEGDTP